jgi:transcriptional regulator with XRE-family HTH domain|nr:MAG TPA: repressor protein [Caudoviricetes sp.]
MDLYIERIKPLLESSGMTDKDIEEALNLPRGVIYKWGIGKNKSYKRFIPEIAKYFNVSADYLMGLDSPSAGIKKDPIPKDEVEDSETAELREIWSSADENERRDLLEMARMLKNRRKQNG